MNLELYGRGMRDALGGKGILLTEQELGMLRNEHQKEQTRRSKAILQTREQLRKRAREENREAGQRFLAEHRKKDGVVVLPSGLQYRVLRAGTGRSPGEADTVECRFKGSLVDGTLFDRSDPSGGTSTLRVAALMPGFREALTRMAEGASWEVVVPPQLAYGERGAGPVGPDSTLLFEVELVSVK